MTMKSVNYFLFIMKDALIFLQSLDMVFSIYVAVYGLKLEIGLNMALILETIELMGSMVKAVFTISIRQKILPFMYLSGQ